MKEQKIVVEIGRDGQITADAEGFSGDTCLKELDLLLEGLANIPPEVKRKSDRDRGAAQINTKQNVGRKS